MNTFNPDEMNEIAWLRCDERWFRVSSVSGPAESAPEWVQLVEVRLDGPCVELALRLDSVEWQTIWSTSQSFEADDPAATLYSLRYAREWPASLGYEEVLDRPWPWEKLLQTCGAGRLCWTPFARGDDRDIALTSVWNRAYRPRVYLRCTEDFWSRQSPLAEELASYGGLKIEVLSVHPLELPGRFYRYEIPSPQGFVYLVRVSAPGARWTAYVVEVNLPVTVVMEEVLLHHRMLLETLVLDQDRGRGLRDVFLPQAIVELRDTLGLKNLLTAGHWHELPQEWTKHLEVTHRF